MRKVYKAAGGLLTLLFLSLSSGMSGVHAQDEKPELVVSTYQTIYLSLGEEFTLHAEEAAIIKDEDLEIKVKRFYNSPCPPNVRCFWSGVGGGLQYATPERFKVA